MSSESESEPDDGDAARAVLDDWFCDLVAAKRCEPWLRELFAAPKGAWLDADMIARKLGATPVQVPFDEPGAIWLTWIDPPPGSSPGFCLVMGYDDRSIWSKLALYNRAWLLSRDAETT